jgi:alkanesulfonate monooxygenase SsuD/methylene tetrahydromethanopterin reductase-like flavin-dependent oxidoreductase (luciferase family)
VAGTPEQYRTRIEAYRKLGLDGPIISPSARGPDAKERFETVIRACAPASAG